MEAMLGRPRVLDDGGRRATLAEYQGAAGKRVMAVMPGGFDEDAPHMGIAGLGNRAARLLGATRVFRGYEPDEAPEARRGRKAARVAEFGGDGEGREIVDATEAAQARDAGAQRLDGEQIAQLKIEGLKPRDAFVDGADVGTVGLLAGPAARRRGVWSRPSSWL